MQFPNTTGLVTDIFQIFINYLKIIESNVDNPSIKIGSVDIGPPELKLMDPFLNFFFTIFL